ncbi:MAG: PilZ domain-containing protein [Anaerolineales bacterium]|nr:PilZ domain-containing protein [Anaerolineales bacterium]
MLDRRKEHREKLTAFTPVYDLHTGALLGYLADLTLHGLRVTGGHPLKVNKQATLAIEFPKAIGIEPARFTVLAHVTHCAADGENASDYNIGFEFLEVTAERLRVIEAVLKKYRF